MMLDGRCACNTCARSRHMWAVVLRLSAAAARISIGSLEVFCFLVRVWVTSFFLWMICPSLWHHLASFLLRVGRRAACSPCLPRSRRSRAESQGSSIVFVLLLLLLLLPRVFLRFCSLVFHLLTFDFAFLRRYQSNRVALCFLI